MVLQVKKIVDISATYRKNSIIIPKEEENYSFRQLRERTKKIHFEMYCFKSTLTEECTFC